MLFKKMLNKSRRKPNKIWVDKGSLEKMTFQHLMKENLLLLKDLLRL